MRYSTAVVMVFMLAVLVYQGYRIQVQHDYLMTCWGATTAAQDVAERALDQRDECRRLRTESLVDVLGGAGACGALYRAHMDVYHPEEQICAGGLPGFRQSNKNKSKLLSDELYLTRNE